MTTDRELKTLDEAKTYFISMGCSHFHLDREDFKLAKEYRSLNISSETESKWRREEFERKLKKDFNKDQPEIGFMFSNLADMSETTNFYLEQLADLTNQIIGNISNSQIGIILSAIVGSNSTNTHGGLIEKAYKIQRIDLGQVFIKYALSLIDKADSNKVDITFQRGNLADIIHHFNISELNDIALKLRQVDEIHGFVYYENGAKEGNKFSMNMLSNYYKEGKGCKVDLEKANYWEEKAKN
jgi:hypothetical protein